MANSNKQVSGCTPLEPPTGNVFQPVRALVTEMIQLTPEDYRGAVVTLKVTLGPGLLSGNIEFRVPMTHNLIIERIEPHIALIDVVNEFINVNHPTDDQKGIGSFGTSPDVEGRIALKAMNCRLTLYNADRDQPVLMNGPASLYSLIRHPTDWTNKPHIVPAGELLRGEVSLVQQTPMLLGGDTEYGLVIKGSIVRVKAS